MIETGTPEFSIDLLKAGDRAEFARLVDAYYTQIFRLALKMLGDSSDAEDALQNTFLKAVPVFRPGCIGLRPMKP